MESPDKDMDSLAISRSGRVLKRPAKLKDMEHLDASEFESQLKPRKKLKGEDEFDDKRITPMQIPKISLSVPTPSSSFMSPSKKMKCDNLRSPMPKIPPFPSPVKSKLDPNLPLFQESSTESSTSETSSSSTSSSEESSDAEMEHPERMRAVQQSNKISELHNMRHPLSLREKVIIESYSQQLNSPQSFVGQNNKLNICANEEDTSDSNLVSREESNNMRRVMMSKGKKGSAAKREPVRKTVVQKPKPPLKKKPAKQSKAPAAQKKPQTAKEKKVTAYSLWCSENRKKIQAQNPMLFSSISKKMGEAWQALPEKEKMAWRRKAKKMTQKGGSIISTGRQSDHTQKSIRTSTAVNGASTMNAASLEHSSNFMESDESVGTTSIDVAAHLKLLGNSLSVIGNRLIEHEGEITVSGVCSVLLDSTVCALGPLLCLFSEVKEISDCNQSATYSRILDNIAYFMPGL